MFTPSLARISLMSCGWTPSTVKDRMPQCSSGFSEPRMWTCGTLRSFSSARVVSAISLAVDRVEADAADIVDRGVQPGGAGSVDGAGLELVGKLGIRRALARDRLDHLAAREKRRHLIEQLAAAVEPADAHRP